MLGPLASVVEYFGDELDTGEREFVPTAELIDALDAESTAFGRAMGELGCRPERGTTTVDDGKKQQVRGYRIANLRASIAAIRMANRRLTRTTTASQPVTTRQENPSTRHPPCDRLTVGLTRQNKDLDGLDRLEKAHL